MSQVSTEYKPVWQCPTCRTNFDKHGIGALINSLELWINNRGVSPTLDPFWDKVVELNRLVGELKSIHRAYVRKPTNMMQAQNAIGASENDN